MKDQTIQYLKDLTHIDRMKKIQSYSAIIIGFICISIALHNMAFAGTEDPNEKLHKAKQQFSYHQGAQDEIEYLLSFLQERVNHHREDGKVKDYKYHLGAIHELQYQIEIIRQERWNEHQDQKKIAEKKGEEAREMIKKKAQIPVDNLHKSASKEYWVIEGAEEYKIERMKFAQDYAQTVGVGDYSLDIVAQLHRENGSWDERRRGDQGCSVGLSQINTCARVSMRNHPQLYDWKFQITSLVDEVKHNYEKYNDFKRAQLGWNCPRCMANNKYNGYVYHINTTKKLFTLKSL